MHALLNLPSRRLVRLLLATALAGGLAACASVPGNDAFRPQGAGHLPAGGLKQQALAAIASGDARQARRAAELLLLGDMRAPGAHLLLGAAHQLDEDPAMADLARSGFDASLRLGEGSAWPHYLTGLDALRRHQPGQAVDAFASAVMADPDAAWTYEGLAGAAYLAGDLVLAEAAALRAVQLSPASRPGWRAGVLAAAAGNDAVALQARLSQAPEAVPASEREWVRERAFRLLRTAAVDTLPTPADAGAQAAEEQAPQQLSVDVTLILGDLRQSRGIGVNLLESLQMQFGKTEQRQRVVSGGSSSVSTAITRLIRVPDITYNLNILNRGTRRYEVIARPSLSAFLGEQSTFFVGEQLNVAVAATNFAQLEKIDVGVGLKITPAEIRADGARFRVEAERSFFSDQGVGSFSQQLATFKQNVAATADVRFGETLVLSGLSESVSDGNESGVPVLGDVPGLDLLFNRKTDLRRQRSVIILVTPSTPLGLRTGDTRSASVRSLMRLWNSLAQAEHGMEALSERIQSRPFFSRAAVGDVQVRDLRDADLMREFTASISGAGTPVAMNLGESP
jgi:tetratricopeptide (TPR) repeat protein